MTQQDRYSSFAELARNAREGHDYRRLAERRGSGVAIIAPHGGGIEPGTSEIAAALAGREFALYCFEGLRPSGNDELHVTSHCFDDPACLQLVEDARVILAVHGCAGEHQAVYVGGLDRDLQARLIEALRRAGFDARSGASDRAGCYTSNICNRGSTGRGVQLELTRGLRLEMFKGFKWHERQITTPVFDRFVTTIRDGLISTIEDRQFANVRQEAGGRKQDMINELKPGEYEIARPIFKGLRYNLAIFSVLEGNTPGSVYVDTLADPKTAFVWDKSRDSGFYLEGYARNAGFNASLNRLILEQLYPEAQALPGVLDFTLHYFPETWEDQFGVVLKGTNPMKNWRTFYAFRQLQVDWRRLVPPGFALRPVDGELLARTGLTNVDRLAHWAQDSWSSVDNFLRRGFGFCLVHGNDVASWCMADYASGDRCEIGIHTDERYRRRGFATLTAAATVEHCISNGIPHVGWHCWGTNLASAATAEKVGFEKGLDYPVVHAWFNAFDNCLVHGGYDLGRKQFRQSAEWYERAFQMADAGEEAALDSHWFSDAGNKAGCYYNAACAWALVGESEAAIRNLNRAIDSGWTDAEHLGTDEDLESLHGTQGWEDLMERLA